MVLQIEILRSIHPVEDLISMANIVLPRYKWENNYTHQADSGSTAKIESIQSDFSTAIKNESSFSIYMFCGGTNWGFQTGADFGYVYEPVTTSYDYGAPLDESGRPNDVHNAIRQTVTSFVDGVPDVPSMPATDLTTMTPYTPLFDQLPQLLFRPTTRCSAEGPSYANPDKPRDRDLLETILEALARDLLVNKKAIVYRGSASGIEVLSRLRQFCNRFISLPANHESGSQIGPALDRPILLHSFSVFTLETIFPPLKDRLMQLSHIKLFRAF